VPFSDKADGTDISFGIGLGYDFTRNLGLRAEWEFFNTDQGDASLLSVGILFRF
jgi:opacity protein-like surface antigen